MIDKKKVELLSPVGDFSCLKAAINNGADSIYFGIGQLNMRARSTTNFNIENINEISNICKKKNVKTYLTINTIIYDHDLSFVKKIIFQAKKYEIDAVIVMDQSVMNYAYNIGMNVHLSTQVNVTNTESVKFYSNFSDAIILSRELSLVQIKNIIKYINKNNIKGPSGKLLKIEIFVHGALCMAISGKCYLSLHYYNSSANRGACKQNCRKKYIVINKENNSKLELDHEYIMSSKDLCTISFLDKIINTGVKILKIEGRGRSPEYVSVTTSCYREAIDSIYNKTFNKKKIVFWIKRLKKVYNRGFWNGYYLGNKIGEWSKVSGSLASQKKIYLGRGIHYYTNKKIAEFLIESYTLKIGDKILIIGPTTGVKKIKVDYIMVKNIFKKKVFKGQICTIPVKFKIRSSDKIYKLIKK